MINSTGRLREIPSPYTRVRARACRAVVCCPTTFYYCFFFFFRFDKTGDIGKNYTNMGVPTYYNSDNTFTDEPRKRAFILNRSDITFRIIHPR